MKSPLNCCFRIILATMTYAGFCLYAARPASTAAAGEERQNNTCVVLEAMTEELARCMDGFQNKGDPPPYFMSYFVVESKRIKITATNGALKENDDTVERLLDVDVRVGDYRMDNTHAVRGNPLARMLASFSAPVPIPVEDDVDAIKSVLWLQSDRKYKEAVEKLIEAQTSSTVKVDEEDQSADFSREEPEYYLGPKGRIEVNTSEWEQLLKEQSGAFAKVPEIYTSGVSLLVNATTKYLVNSEGTKIRYGSTHARLSIYAETKAEDGMELYRFEAFDSHTMGGLPDKAAIRRAIEEIIADLLALREAPVMEPYTGPAILSGRAAGVFFHESFGHRIEGHRQKDDEEGQTFTKKIGEQVMPDFISIYDDPTIMDRDGKELNGYYLYDDEGVKARRVEIVESGILKNFLMSRQPVEGFENSNGHGRKQISRRAVGRQGNFIVEAAGGISENDLRKLLINECLEQEKPYGLFFKDISGGFTYTGRGLPQFIDLRPILVYRVFADGRPDELVRGVDMIGTPLVSISKILACGNKHEVFNGYCGAESGLVPVSAVAPSVLTQQIEIQKSEKSAERPPLLPPPRKGGLN